MNTRIKVWQVNDKTLSVLEDRLASRGRTEPEDLQRWIESEPSILGEDMVIIGAQVQTRSGPLDLLGIDFQGNTVIVELKRDRIPREAVAQAVDYASDVATWDVLKLSSVCMQYRQKELEEYLSEVLPESVAFEDLSINRAQRILLVGTGMDEALDRMINWLADEYQVPINALLLTYIVTSSGDELLARMAVIAEESERAIVRKKLSFPTSDDPGTYGEDELRQRLAEYLSDSRPTPRRIRTVLFPLCLEAEPVTRAQIKQRLMDLGEANDDRQAGLVVGSISRELGLLRYDFLRQVVRWERPGNWWEKENYRIPDEYKDLVRSLLTS